MHSNASSNPNCRLFAGFILLTLIGCSGSPASSGTENGGTAGDGNVTGGQIGSSTSTGGRTGSAGGAFGTTGGIASSQTSGGAASGGVPATGGTSVRPTGGTPATGGVPATGGTSARPTGGTPATGGTTVSPTGGAPATGGVPATGGISARPTGGAPTGGTAATGGARPTGGAPATGGTAAGGTGTTIGSLALRGVNLSCAEWGTNIPGTFNTDYTYPDSHYVTGYNGGTYYTSKKMTVFRLPFLWERLQRTLSQAFDSTELTRLDTTVTDLLATGAYVILDPHNYARYNNTVIGTAPVTQAAFADLWTRLATQYGSSSKVIFGLMNEPHDIDNTTWVNAAQAAINAIRNTGAKNLILVPSNSYTNAAVWSTYADPLLTITDSANNLVFEAHNYFNADASASDTCTSTTIGVERLTNFTNWLKTNNRKGFLGEFSGASGAANCQAAVTNMLDHIVANSSVYIGWAWWAGGPWWGTNWATLEPSGGTDNPKMAWLTPYL